MMLHSIVASVLLKILILPHASDAVPNKSPRLLLPSPFLKSLSFGAFCQCQWSCHYFLHRFERRKKCIPWPVSAIAPRTEICNQNTDTRSGRNNEDKKSILLLNRRKLPKQIMKCRTDANRALSILGNAYPHLSFSLEDNDEAETLQGWEWSYERLLGVLHGGNQIKVAFDDTLIIDGKSIVATMEVFLKSHNVPAAMHLLSLSVRGVIHNRKFRKKLAQENEFISIGGDGTDQSALFLLEDDNDKNELRQIYKAVLSLLGHTNQRQGGSNSTRLIIYLLRHHMPNIAQIQPGSEIYHAAINALGKFGQCALILDILEEMEHSHQLNLQEEAEPLTTYYVPPIDRMAYQTAISSLARHGHCREATHLLYRMQSKGFEQPDMNIYNELLIGIAKEAGKGVDPTSIGNDNEGTTLDASGNETVMPWHKVALQIMEMCNRPPTAQVYNSVISACMKEGAWDEAARVTEKAASLNTRGVSMEILPSGISSVKNEDNCMQSKRRSSSSVMNQNTSTYFQNLECFCKVGKGNDSWWEIGRYSVADDKCEMNAAVQDNSEGCETEPSRRVRDIIIGIQPHRNPVSNGLSIVFFDEESRVRLGRMLLKNTYQTDEDKRQVDPHHYSSFMGMEVNKARRGEGLSKVFVAIWLRICLKTNVYPRAAVMNKPLIAHVLMGFNFIPQAGGTRVELIRLENDDDVTDRNEDGYNPQFGLYSSSRKSLQGLFSKRVLRMQNIAILDHLPPSYSREKRTIIYLKTKFEHPIAVVENAVHYIPPSSLQNDNIDFTFGGRKNGDGTSFRVDGQQEQEQKAEASQSNVQRKLLDRQLHSILKTNNSKSATGQLKFLSNSTLLRRAFISLVSNG